MEFSKNFVAVLVAGLVPTILGMLWYSPLMFSKPWLRSLGVKEGDLADANIGAAKGYIVSFFLGFVLSYGMAIIIWSLNLTILWHGLLLAAGLWLAFNFSSFGKLIYFEDRPKLLVLIDGGYDLLSFVVVAGILTVWH